jgi:lysozyme
VTQKADEMTLGDALKTDNMRAFLAVIRSRESSLGPEAYSMIVGGKKFKSFADHPRIKGKIWKDANGKTNYSTAAGAYQITEETWDWMGRGKLGLKDFSPASQDLCAVGLIEYRGALDDVLAGRLKQAISKCRREWTSLPGGPEELQNYEAARAVYLMRRGTLAEGN